MVAPSFPNIHRMGAELPEECMFLLPFHSFKWNICGPIPGYHEWAAQRDYTEDYRYYRQALQILQFGRERPRWVLKSPCHMWTLDALAKVFPDAKIVWTHRDPVTVLGSYCSFMEISWSMSQRPLDPHQLGETSLRLLVDGVARARKARFAVPKANLVDVGYPHLAGDARNQVPKLFARLDLPWDEASAGHLEYLLGRPGQSRRHEYVLTHYGLDSTTVEGAFDDYPRMVGNLPALSGPKSG